MPGSLHPSDANSERYYSDSDDESHIQTGKSVLYNHKLRSQVSIINLSQQDLPPSPADSDHNEMRGTDESSEEESRLMRPMDRGAPGERLREPTTPQQKEFARKKSQYYQEQFAYRESNTSAKERLTKDSMIMADVRTNVIIQDEYTFITDLSYALSTRYQRPESSIIVTIAHSVCLLYAGNFDPAYTMTITAVQSQLQPVTNKRNAALLAKSMEESLGVAPERGLIKFVPIPEENFATGGMTLAGAIDELDKQIAEENGVSVKHSLSVSRNKRHSMRSLRSTKKGSNLPNLEEQITPTMPTPPSSDRIVTPPLPPVPPISKTRSVADLRAEKAKKMGRRKSFIATMFGRKEKDF